MHQEIERKFMVKDGSWRTDAGRGIGCRQGYISSVPEGVTVRIRLMGVQGFLTVKGPSKGISRPEMEYEIPAGDAEYMLENFCAGMLIEKVRYTLNCKGYRWEIDEFSGSNAGLVIAEIELRREDQFFEKPDWLGAEVSGDSRYYNAALARRPFSRW